MEGILFIDFDGVLAMPRSNPVKLYPNIPLILERLSKHYVLCLVSFNPSAIRELRRLNVLKYFKATRAGTTKNIEVSEKTGDRILCKYLQISSIIQQLSKDPEMRIHELTMYFFDDDINNIETVNMINPNIRTVLVDWYTGLNDLVLDVLRK